MARQASDINPDDVFPKRNLDVLAEPWGRALEERVIALEKAAKAQQDSLGGTNRTLAASASNLSDQIQAVVATDGGSNTGTDFTLTSGVWVTAASVVIPIPTWTDQAVVNASAAFFLASNDAFAVPVVRLVINGLGSMEFELPSVGAASGNPFFGSLAFTRKLGTFGNPVTVSAQVFVLDSTKWYTGASNRVAQVNATTIFTH